jgi:CRP/FNR family cyclic AMP-dependent transcriptional regulator
MRQTARVDVGLNLGGEAFAAPVLAQLCQRYGVHYEPGAAIVHEKDPTDELSFVVSGRVEFSVCAEGGRRVLNTAGRGTLFGEVSCFGGLPRSATATALEDAFLLKFDRQTAMQLVSTSPRFALRVIQTLGDRLRTATARAEAPAERREPRPAFDRRPLTIGEALRASR